MSPWWIPHPLAQRTLRRVREGETGTLARQLLTDAPLQTTWLDVASQAATAAATQPDDLEARWQRLRDLRQVHDRPLPGAVAGIPSRLWRQWTSAAAVSAPATSTLSTEGRVVGAVTGSCREIWLDEVAPGAAYGQRLWGWGRVEAPQLLPVGALSPRAAWAATGDRWTAHPALLALAQAHPARPRVTEGPGHLIACLVDAVAELVAGAQPTPRDLAVLWGTLLLPVLALGRAGTDPLHPDLVMPDFVEAWPFHLLHPRVQVAVLVLDELCTLHLSEDHEALAEVLQDAGLAEPGDSPRELERASRRLMEGIAQRSLRRRAASRWDSGFGFRLFRRLMRSTEPTPGAWDEALRGVLGDVAEGRGHLARRLHDGLRTALSAPMGGPDPTGTAAEQAVALAWWRWTDPLFLQPLTP